MNVEHNKLCQAPYMYPGMAIIQNKYQPKWPQLVSFICQFKKIRAKKKWRKETSNLFQITHQRLTILKAHSGFWTAISIMWVWRYSDFRFFYPPKWQIEFEIYQPNFKITRIWQKFVVFGHPCMYPNTCAIRRVDHLSSALCYVWCDWQSTYLSIHATTTLHVIPPSDISIASFTLTYNFPFKPLTCGQLIWSVSVKTKSPKHVFVLSYVVLLRNVPPVGYKLLYYMMNGWF